MIKKSESQTGETGGHKIQEANIHSNHFCNPPPPFFFFKRSLTIFTSFTKQIYTSQPFLFLLFSDQAGDENNAGAITYFQVSRSKIWVILPCACRAPNFLSFKGVPLPLPIFFRGHFHPLFINLEGITPCSKLLNIHKT